MPAGGVFSSAITISTELVSLLHPDAVHTFRMAFTFTYGSTGDSVVPAVS